MAKPKLGTKYTCASCGTKFYDLGRPSPLCPKCNWNPLDAAPARREIHSAPGADDGGVLKLRSVYEGEDAEEGFEDDAVLGVVDEAEAEGAELEDEGAEELEADLVEGEGETI